MKSLLELEPRVNIKGFAFGGESSESHRERYSHLKESLVKIETSEDGITSREFRGIVLDEKYSELDIALICSQGYLPFGAIVYLKDGKFVCSVHLD